MGGVFWTDLKNSVGEVEAQNLHGSGVDRNVQRMLLLLFFKNMGGVFLTDLRNSVGGVEPRTRVVGRLHEISERILVLFFLS